jgi:hypothetical protein
MGCGITALAQRFRNLGEIDQFERDLRILGIGSVSAVRAKPQKQLIAIAVRQRKITFCQSCSHFSCSGCV